MSAAISPSTGRRYWMRLVSRIWEIPRSSVFYRRQDRPAPRKRGPKPIVPDEALIPMIREDLASSPFREEGHRKVYDRLKHEKCIKVAAKRVLRLMREQALLSPQRSPKGGTRAHDGTICTEKPNEIWGTDATLADLRKALREFVDLYNRRWRLEKLGGHTPDEVRQAWLNTQAA